jgi:7-cyano-7-deazaguanine synthase
MTAIVLLSGGLDSCVVLAHALSLGRTCTALSFHYGQRHLCELQSAQKIAAYYAVEHLIIHIDPSLFSNAALSSLTNPLLPVDTQNNAYHPNTYVPCRNLLFLSHAASLAESRGSSEIFFGAHANDGPSYPDCRPSFFLSFENAVEHGSYIGCNKLRIVCPLIHFDKASVVALGQKINAPLDLTWSCYDPHDGKPCTACTACTLRAKAFR